MPIKSFCSQLYVAFTLSIRAVAFRRKPKLFIFFSSFRKEMDSSNSNGGSDANRSQILNPRSLNVFIQGIYFVLSRWTTLQMAVENQWGGWASLQKSYLLGSEILSWFSHSKGPLYIADLENELDKKMVILFNTEVDDGSVEEVAKQLMVMHEECLKENYKSFENLRMFVLGVIAISQSKRVINNDEYESSYGEASDMMVDEPVVPTMAVEKPKPKEMPDEDGWSVVAPRRNRGKKSGSANNGGSISPKSSKIVL